MSVLGARCHVQGMCKVQGFRVGGGVHLNLTLHPGTLDMPCTRHVAPLMAEDRRLKADHVR